MAVGKIFSSMNMFFRRGVKLIGFFDFDPKVHKRSIEIMRTVFVLIILGISVWFLFKAINHANQFNLWTDEVNGLTSRSSSFFHLISGGQGVGSQVSKAPLDYLAQKLFDQAGLPLLLKRIPLNIYYRLNSIFYNWISGLYVILIIFSVIKKQETSNYLIFSSQMVFLIAALWIYYFWPFNFLFSVQMRPYALWNSLWLIILALFFVDKKFSRLSITLLILLASTANAAIFQLCSLAASFMAIRLLKKEKFRRIMIILLKVFSLPMAISLYYIFIDHSTRYVWYGDFEQYMKEFFRFWVTKEMIPILSVLGILMTIPFKKLRDHAIVFLTMLILYLISPCINYLVLKRGVFFSSRHYIYYDLVYPVFFINVALVIPFYWEQIRKYYSTKNFEEIEKL